MSYRLNKGSLFSSNEFSINDKNANRTKFNEIASYKNRIKTWKYHDKASSEAEALEMDFWTNMYTHSGRWTSTFKIVLCFLFSITQSNVCFLVVFFVLQNFISLACVYLVCIYVCLCLWHCLCTGFFFILYISQCVLPRAMECIELVCESSFSDILGKWDNTTVRREWTKKIYLDHTLKILDATGYQATYTQTQQIPCWPYRYT